LFGDEMKNLIIGIILAIVAIALLFALPADWFLNPTIELIKGAIVPAIAFFALIFLLIGWDELQAQKIEEKVEEETKEEEKKPKKKKK
jgi:protein-S-isoprenylcysteine O-methyltransferase Ste14